MANNALGVHESPGQASSKNGKDKEANVGAVIDISGGFGVDILTKRYLHRTMSATDSRIAGTFNGTYQTSNHGAHVENHPEPRDIATL